MPLGFLRGDPRLQLLAAFQLLVQFPALHLERRQRLAYALQLGYRLLKGLLCCRLLVDLITDGLQIVLSLNSRLARVMQRGARLHLRGAVGTARGVDRGPSSLDVIQHGQIQLRLHSQIRAGLETFHQAIVVVAGSIETKRIAAG